MVTGTIETSGYRRAPRAALLRLIEEYLYFPSFLLEQIFEIRVYAYTVLNYL